MLATFPPRLARRRFWTLRLTTWPLALLFFITCLVLAQAMPASAQDGGRLEGRLVNGTAAGAVPAGATVTVHVIRDRAKAGEQIVRTDEDGRFVLDGLATGPNLLYFPIVDYGGAIYYPDQPILLDGAEPRTTEIRVFEPSRSAEGLAFERLNMFLMAVTPTSLTIMEMGAVVNRSDRAFVGDDTGQTLRMVLPRGATNVAPQAGLPPDTLEALPDGFATTDPIRPGRREFAFSYQLPYDTATLDLAREQPLPVETFTLYAPEMGVGVVSTGLRLQGAADVGGQRYQQHVAEGVAPGAPIPFRLTNLPAPFSLKLRDLGLMVVGIGGAALAIVLLFAFRRRARSEARPLAPVPVDDAERQRLVLALAALDDRFAAGALDEADYRAERERDKRRLVSLLASSPRS